MKYGFKFTGSALILLGIFMIFGAAGSDCDGDCMENAMSISEMVIYSLIGLTSCFTGGCMVNYGDKYYE